MIDVKEINIHNDDLSDQDRAIIRIKKMLNLQSGATTEGEANAAALAVQRELSKHNLELTDVEYVRVVTEEPVEEQYMSADGYGFRRSSRRIVWVERLASAVARAHFCKIYVSTGSNGITFVGRKSNRDVATKAFTYLVNVAQQLAEKDGDEYKEGFERKYDWDKPDTRGFKASFLSGFVSKISSRYEEEAKQIKMDAEDAARREAEEQRRLLIEELLEQKADDILDMVDSGFEALHPDEQNNDAVDVLFAEAEKQIREQLERETPLEAVTSTALVRLGSEKKAVDDWFGKRKWGKVTSTRRSSSHNSAGWSRGNTRGGQVSMSGNVLS